MFKKEFVGITDWKDRNIHEGDIMHWPDEPNLTVVRYEINACQFRAQFDPTTYIPSCHIGLNTEKKGKAVVIGSIYDKKIPIGAMWAVEQNGA